MKVKKDFFNAEDLTSPYHQFEKVARTKMESLKQKEKEWLTAWQMLDLRISPIDDARRRFIRYGHYIGWFEKHIEQKEL